MSSLANVTGIAADRRRRRSWAASRYLGAAMLLLAMVAGIFPGRTAAVAQSADPPPNPTTVAPPDDLLQDWFDLIDRNRAREPAWLSPLITQSPRLSNGFRYDQSWETVPGGKTLQLFGGKGLQAIIHDDVEFDFYLPPYEVKGPGANAPRGFGDWPFINLKYQFLTATETAGDYVVSGILQTVAPTGAAALTNHSYMINPGIAAGKGWGDFVLQGNAGLAFPLQHSGTLGNAGTLNAAAEYHIGRYLWPELELNETYWPNGTKEGKDQLYLTPAVQLGRIPLYGRLGLQIGVGYEDALAPTLPAFRHSWIASVRLIW